jgi:hypothetical protein
MKDFIDIIADTLKERELREKVLLHVENLYFNDLRRFKWLKSFFASELILIAQDVVQLQSSINNRNSIKGINPRSKLMQAEVDRISEDGLCAGINELPEVSEEQKKLFEKLVIKPNRPYVTAAMLAELIREEKRKNRTHRWVTYLIPLITAIITALAVVGANRLSK